MLDFNLTERVPFGVEDLQRTIVRENVFTVFTECGLLAAVQSRCPLHSYALFSRLDKQFSHPTPSQTEQKQQTSAHLKVQETEREAVWLRIVGLKMSFLSEFCLAS